MLCVDPFLSAANNSFILFLLDSLQNAPRTSSYYQRIFRERWPICTRILGNKPGRNGEDPLEYSSCLADGGERHFPQNPLWLTTSRGTVSIISIKKNYIFPCLDLLRENFNFKILSSSLLEFYQQTEVCLTIFGRK